MPTVVLSDQFPGTTIDTAKWATGYRNNSSAGQAATNPSALAVSGGALSMNATHTTNTDGQGNVRSYTTGAISSKASFTYGIVEIKAQFAGGHGMHGSIWLIPADTNVDPSLINYTEQRWEIDMCELPISATDNSFTDTTHGHYTFHWTDTNGANPNQTPPDHPTSADLTTSSHTYRLVWSPLGIVLSLDGVRVLTVDPSTAPIPNRPMVLVISNNVDGGTLWGTDRIIPDATTTWPQTLQVTSVTIEQADTGMVYGSSIGSGDASIFNMQADNGLAHFQTMYDIGLRLVRIGGKAPRVPTGNDAVILAAIAAGLQVQYVLSGYDSSDTSTLSAYETYCTNVATHYGALGVHRYELGNEMNQNSNNPNTGVPSPANFAAMLQACYPLLHTADPLAVVIPAGTSAEGVASQGITDVVWYAGLYANGAGGYFDELACHLYTDGDSGQLPSLTTGRFSHLPAATVTVSGTTYDGLRALMVANGDAALPVSVGEFGGQIGGAGFVGGGSTITEALQATNIVDTFALAAALGYVAVATSFNWIDSSDGNWGLISSAGVQRLSYAAVVAMLASLNPLPVALPARFLTVAGARRRRAR